MDKFKKWEDIEESFNFTEKETKEMERKLKIIEGNKKEIEIDDFFDKETIKSLLKSEADIENGRTKKAAEVIEELRIKYGF